MIIKVRIMSFKTLGLEAIVVLNSDLRLFNIYLIVAYLYNC